MTAARLFTAADQVSFARLSGDHNPLHLDPLAARRSFAGQPILHGVHGLLWALETLAARGALVRLSSLKVSFERFVAVGDQVHLEVTQQTETMLRAEIKATGIATIILIGLDDQQGAIPIIEAPALDDGGQVLEPSWEQMAEMRGRMTAAAPASDFSQAFPALSALIGAGRVADLAALSRLVGMVCPGHHSIFQKLTLTFSPSRGESVGIGFVTKRLDSRFRVLQMEVAAEGFAGTITCLVRLPPVQQPNLADLRELVAAHSLQHANALIVGGSRGLGELTAKIIAAGGGRSIITYHRGRQDAERVAGEITLAGGQCDVMPFDVSGDMTAQLAGLPFPPRQLYYFASSRIFRQREAGFAPALLADFMQVYVEGFYRLCAALERPLAVFYPSSVAVSERPKNITEYAMAKAAGEILCQDLPALLPGVTVEMARLPRLATDQTASIADLSEPVSAVAVLLPLIRTVSALA